jgi:hypothetical protein
MTTLAQPPRLRRLVFVDVPMLHRGADALADAPGLIDLEFGSITCVNTREVLKLFGPGFKSGSTLKRLGVEPEYFEAVRDALSGRFPGLTVWSSPGVDPSTYLADDGWDGWEDPGDDDW